MTKGSRLDAQLVLFSSVLFVLFAAFSQLSKLINAESLLRSGQYISLLVLALLVVAKLRMGVLPKFSLAPLIILIFILVNGLVSYTRNAYPPYIMISIVQIAMFFWWLFICELMPRQLSGKLVGFLTIVSMLSVVFSIFEFFLPISLRGAFLEMIYGGDIPVAYFSRDLGASLNVLRLGSFFFSPLTFAFAVVSLIFLMLSAGLHKKVLFVSAVAVASLVKTAYLGFALSRVYFMSCRFLFVALVLLLFCITFAPIFVSAEDVLAAPDDAWFKSLSNHYVGLVAGIEEGYKKPFFGNGLGSSGYLIYLESRGGGPSPFQNISPYLNGNESGLGVLAFQMGLLFLLAYYLLMLWYALEFYRQRNTIALLYLLFLIVFQASSESNLTMFVSSVSAIVIVHFRRKGWEDIESGVDRTRWRARGDELL